MTESWVFSTKDVDCLQKVAVLLFQMQEWNIGKMLNDEKFMEKKILYN